MESTPFLYRLGKAIGRIVLRVYFGKIGVRGGDRVPADGPVIFAANHPNSITDSLVLGLTVGRTIRFLGHSGLFQSRLQGFLLRQAGVIPVHRRSEEGDAGERNREMFRACTELLERRGAIGIFPEGVSRPAGGLLKLKTGTARIALTAESANAFALGVKIVPTGLNFESRGRFRSDVLVSLGEPIETRAYRDLWKVDPYEAVNSLTVELERRIREEVMMLGRDERTGLIRDIGLTYEDELAERKDIGIGELSGLGRKQVLSREIARAVDYYSENDPSIVWHVGRSLRHYRSRLEEVRITDAQLRREAGSSISGEALKLLILGLAGLPFAIYGAFWNALPYKMTGFVAKRIAEDATKFHYFQIIFGTLFYLVYYPPVFLLLRSIYGTAPAVALAVSFVPTGFFARWYGRTIGRRRESLRFAWLQATRRYLVEALRRQRRRIIDEMNGILEDYLARTATRPGPPDRSPEREWKRP